MKSIKQKFIKIKPNYAKIIMKHKINSLKDFKIKQENHLFQNAQQLPTFFKKNLLNPNRVVKVFRNDRDANIRIFYFQYLRLCFDIEPSRAQLFIEKIQQLLNNKQFEFLFLPNDPPDLFNDFQFKSLVVQFFHFFTYSSLSIQQALDTYPIMDTVFIYLFRSFLALSEQISFFNADIDRYSTFNFLAHAFSLPLDQYGICIRFLDADVFAYEEDANLVYMAYLLEDNKLSEVEEESSQAMNSNTSTPIHRMLDINKLRKQQEKYIFNEQTNNLDSRNNNLRYSSPKALQNQFRQLTYSGKCQTLSQTCKVTVSQALIEDKVNVGGINSCNLSKKQQNNNNIFASVENENQYNMPFINHFQYQNKKDENNNQNKKLIYKKKQYQLSKQFVNYQNGEDIKKTSKQQKMQNICNLEKLKNISNDQKYIHQQISTSMINIQYKHRKEQTNKQLTTQIQKNEQQQKQPLFSAKCYNEFKFYHSQIINIEYKNQKRNSFQQKYVSKIQLKLTDTILDKAQNKKQSNDHKQQKFIKIEEINNQKNKEKFKIPCKNVKKQYSWNLDVTNQFTNSCVFKAMSGSHVNVIRKTRQNARKIRTSLSPSHNL